jgi:carboxymethylenebutenolidase
VAIDSLPVSTGLGEEKQMPDIDIGAVAGGSASLRGYLVAPAGDGPWPGVVAIHEALGLNDVVRRQADRLAAAGYVTFAPDLFSDGGAARCLVGTFRAMFTGRGKALADIEAARSFVLDRDDCSGKVGIIGFCMGGGFALVTANRGFDVAAPNYGVLPRQIETALSGACPVVASYGRKDPSLRGAANKLTRTLTELGIEHDVKEYPKAGHSFLNDQYFGPAPAQQLQRILHVGPEPESAVDAWQRIEAFFAEHLAG